MKIQTEFRRCVAACPDFPEMTGVAADEGWTPLFDGKTLDGWKVHGGNAEYTVEDGEIVGTTVEGSPNTFLCKGDFTDFVLELEVKCDPRLNSGIQVRSHVYEKDTPQASDPKRVRTAGTVYGPQCEITEQGSRHVGQLLGRSPPRPAGSTTSPTSPRRKTPSRTASGTATGSWSRATAIAPGSTACPPPTSPTTWTSTASSGSRSTPSRRARAVSGPLAEHPHQGVEAG